MYYNQIKKIKVDWNYNYVLNNGKSVKVVKIKLNHENNVNELCNFLSENKNNQEIKSLYIYV